MNGMTNRAFPSNELNMRKTREMGFSENESTVRAKLLYTSMIGLEYTSVSGTLERRLEMAKFLCRKD